MSENAGVAHLNLNVSDVARSERFYVEALGFVRLADTSEEVEYEGRRFVLKQIVVGRPSGRDLLALSEAPGVPVGPGGMNHYGVVVPDAEVHVIAERVTAAGGSVLRKGRRSHNGVEEAYAYVQDPDGYKIEVSSQAILYALDPRRRETRG
jgi:catechol 2,3-dioxygenase-like lactoylglutathione lyase family enzyme